LPRDLTSVQRRARRTSGESCTWLVSVTWHRVAKGFESHGPWASDPNPIWTGDTDVPCTLGSHQICARTFSSSLHPAWAFQFAPITQAVAQRKAESYTTVPLKKWQPNTIVLVAAPNQIMPDLTQQWRLGDVWLAAIPCHAAVMAATVMASVCRLRQLQLVCVLDFATTVAAILLATTPQFRWSRHTWHGVLWQGTK
jgi:hypothetical protein